jgi:hypothetical protein
MRPSRSCIMNPMHLAIIRRYWCGVGKGPSWVSETCFRCTMSVREGSERSGTNEERGILENSAVREDHDWRFFSVGPRHFSNLSTSLVLRVSCIRVKKKIMSNIPSNCRLQASAPGSAYPSRSGPTADLRPLRGRRVTRQ